jgi:hypothetical protein
MNFLEIRGKERGWVYLTPLLLTEIMYDKKPFILWGQIFLRLPRPFRPRNDGGCMIGELVN